MYSLLVGVNDEVIPAGRLFEHTEDYVKASLGADYSLALQHLPALCMPEIGDNRYEQTARVGTITHLRGGTRGHTFRFVPNPNLAPIAATTIQNLANRGAQQPRR